MPVVFAWLRGVSLGDSHALLQPFGHRGTVAEEAPESRQVSLPMGSQRAQDLRSAVRLGPDEGDQSPVLRQGEPIGQPLRAAGA